MRERHPSIHDPHIFTMTQPAAKQGDAVTGTDTHVVLAPGQPPTPVPIPFAGQLAADLCVSVQVEHCPAATVASVAQAAAHLPPPGSTFQRPPSCQGTVVTGSQTVLSEGRSMARGGDTVSTCNDPADQPVATIHSTCTVFVG